MTLDELVDTLRAFAFDDAPGTLLSETRARRLINMAMRQVCNWVLSLNGAYLLHCWHGTISNPSGHRRVLINMPGEIYANVHAILDAERVGVAVGDDGTLEIVDFASVRFSQRAQAELRDKPPVYVYNSQVGFVEPKHNIQVRVWYAHHLPAMAHANDTPGQYLGLGVANKLPEAFQGLIPVYAAGLALASEGGDAVRWFNIYEEQKAQLAASLPPRRRAQEQP